MNLPPGVAVVEVFVEEVVLGGRVLVGDPDAGAGLGGRPLVATRLPVSAPRGFGGPKMAQGTARLLLPTGRDRRLVLLAAVRDGVGVGRAVTAVGAQRVGADTGRRGTAQDDEAGRARTTVRENQYVSSICS